MRSPRDPTATLGLAIPEDAIPDDDVNITNLGDLPDGIGGMMPTGAHASWDSTWDLLERNLGDVAHRDHGAWGIAYPSMEKGVPARIGASVQKSGGSLGSSKTDYSRMSAAESPLSPARRLSVGTVDSDHDLERLSSARPIDLVSLQKSHGRESEEVIRNAVPLQPWFRASQSLFQVTVGTACIQVGFKEEDRICMATFCSLLIVCGFVKLVQASIEVFLIIRRIGIKGEEARATLLLVEFLLWVSVLHAVVTASCENLKLEAMACVYLLSCTVVWLVNSVLWLLVFSKLEALARVADARSPRWEKTVEQTREGYDIILDTSRSGLSEEEE